MLCLMHKIGGFPGSLGAFEVKLSMVFSFVASCRAAAQEDGETLKEGLVKFLEIDEESLQAGKKSLEERAEFVESGKMPIFGRELMKFQCDCCIFCCFWMFLVMCD